MGEGGGRYGTSDITNSELQLLLAVSKTLPSRQKGSFVIIDRVGYSEIQTKVRSGR